jgi:myo-inositol-1(or 4)-monophosphatase
MNLDRDLEKIHHALLAAQCCASAFTPGNIEVKRKTGGDPVTEVDLALDKTLKDALLEGDDGWLSEETADDSRRLGKKRVWIVDPLDGTREFVEGIPEWCISIGLVIDGKPVAGGICNPATNQIFVGSRDSGLYLNGIKARVGDKKSLEGARILVSRSEIRKGLWKRFEHAPFEIIPCGSVAYKLALVASGQADAIVSMVPKNEWDIAGGIALVEAAGGSVVIPDRELLIMNQPQTLIAGLTACGKQMMDHLKSFFMPHFSN